jgi:hypothetical protein
MEESLRTLQESGGYLGYPPKPTTSKYRRTGTLGKSLGMSGGKPTVYSMRGTGSEMQGRYGTNLSYAKYVIDDNRQAYMHKNWWWTMKVLKDRAEDKIARLWDSTISKILKLIG